LFFYLGLTSLIRLLKTVSQLIWNNRFGSGEIQPTEAIQSAKPTAAQAAAATDDDVISQDTEDAVQ
jgi:hypothetical protein